LEREGVGIGLGWLWASVSRVDYRVGLGKIGRARLG